MSSHIPTIAEISTNPYTDLLLEIDQISEEYIPDLVQIVRIFRQSVAMQKTSLNSWENALNEINHPDPIKQQQRKTNIQQLLESWNESGDQQDEEETLEIIQSLKGISI